ncbi:type II secretion system protein [uncultured Victivallis sp.]|uniref:pilus assembly FimT family protein n=1 Tax=uncultured Victivallis sp. TaxID=354118 RepID=UPI0025844C40|nr:type II secretion system protein [uncultured Victivallis sp.]
MKFSQKVVCAVLKNGNAPFIVHDRENSQQWKQAENDETVGPDMNKRTKRNFTLIELLVVMLLMGVLMTLMLPAFNRMISGNKVDQCASSLKLGLEQAQSHAITSRRYVALILPNGPDTPYQDYKFGGYRMAYVENIDAQTQSCDFLSWVPNAEWKNKPDGAMLVRISNAATNFPAAQGITDTIRNSSSTLGTELKTLRDCDGETLTNSAIIFSPYGGASLEHNIKLVVAEALFNGNNILFPTRDNRGPVNFLILEINKYSGRVEYVTQ